MNDDEKRLLNEMMEINMFYLIFTKYAYKLYPFDTGWKRYFKNIGKFYYFRKMRKEIKETINKSNLYDLIINWLSLITFCKSSDKGEEYIHSKINNNTYSYSLVESENKKEADYFEINLKYPNRFYLNIQSRKNSSKSKGLDIAITYSTDNKAINKSTHFTVYDNGIIASEYKELYKNIENLVKEYVFFAVIHDLYFIIPKIVWREEEDDTRRNIGNQR